MLSQACSDHKPDSVWPYQLTQSLQGQKNYLKAIKRFHEFFLCNMLLCDMDLKIHLENLLGERSFKHLTIKKVDSKKQFTLMLVF